MLKSFLTFLLIGLVIILRIQLNKPRFVDGERIKIASRVLTQPIVFGRSQYFRLMGLKVYLPVYPELSYGDRVKVVGLVEGDTLKNARLLEYSPSDHILDKFRNKLLDVYKRSLPTDEASLFAGVVIGSKSGISERFWDNLVNSGTAHVVVASGMNVTLVGGFLLAICIKVINRRRAIVFVISGIWIYCILCGLEAPIVRAGIMGTIAFLAQESGRLNRAVRALTIAGISMILIEPSWISDAGFILSFAATTSLILFSAKVDRIISGFKYLRHLPKVVAESLSTTVAAQILIVPVLCFTFGRYNPLSIIANTLTLWAIPPITILGFVGGILGVIFLPLGKIVLIAAYPLARYFTFVINLF